MMGDSEAPTPDQIDDVLSRLSAVRLVLTLMHLGLSAGAVEDGIACIESLSAEVDRLRAAVKGGDAE